MKKRQKALISVLLVTIITAMLLVPALAAGTPVKIDYVALGDSVAAGVRGGVGVPGSEAGSDKSYTNTIALKLYDTEFLGTFNHDFCVSGMTARLLAQNTAVLRDPSTAAAKLYKDAEIATMDIGANDLLGPLYAYVATLKSVSDVNPVKAKEVLGDMVQNLYQGTLGTDVQADIETILQNILAANPTVKIYVMGYYNPLPAISATFGVDLNAPTRYFNTFIQKAIANTCALNASASITYVESFDAMAASPAALVPTDIHPTEAGYRVLADAFWKSMMPYLNKLKAAAVPYTYPIVVNGLTIPFNAFLVNDTIYLKLRDVAMALNTTPMRVSLGWDSATNTILLTSGQPYVPVGGELTLDLPKPSATAYLSPCAFLYDGAPINLTAYLIGDVNYISLSDLAQAFNIAVNISTAGVTINITGDAAGASAKSVLPPKH